MWPEYLEKRRCGVAECILSKHNFSGQGFYESFANVTQETQGGGVRRTFLYEKGHRFGPLICQSVNSCRKNESSPVSQATVGC